MAIYEWSHSQEAYDNVRKQIRDMDVEQLRIIAAEIITYRLTLEKHNQLSILIGDECDEHPVCPTSYFDEQVYSEMLGHDDMSLVVNWHKTSTEEFTELSEFIWNFTSEQRSCSNMSDAHLCPYGCHTVPFSIDENE
ncbi:hypothetical protein [Scytonema sp. NUACC26]|uniref:hypothetical protein n=1 Tax=Scytonema sp. NUACC26 TaxID=3140176 RepID=UPI0034DC9129